MRARRRRLVPRTRRILYRRPPERRFLKNDNTSAQRGIPDGQCRQPAVVHACPRPTVVLLQRHLCRADKSPADVGHRQQHLARGMGEHASARHGGRRIRILGTRQCQRPRAGRACARTWRRQQHRRVSRSIFRTQPRERQRTLPIRRGMGSRQRLGQSDAGRLHEAVLEPQPVGKRQRCGDRMQQRGRRRPGTRPQRSVSRI